MVHTRKPVFKTTGASLNILTVDTLDDVALGENNNSNSAVKVPTSSGSTLAAPNSSGERMPTSFQGFDMKTDPEIRRQAKKSWFDLDSSSTATTPFVSASPFEGISGTMPAFPPADEHPQDVPAAAVDDKEEEKALDQSPSTPQGSEEEAAPPVSSPPLKPGEEDVDGAEGFEQEQQSRVQVLPEAGIHVLPSYSAAPQNQFFNHAAPQYNHLQQQRGGQQPHFQQQPQYVGAFRSHHHRQQHQSVSPPPAPLADPRSTGSSPGPEGTVDTEMLLPSNLQQRPANYELMGFLPFYKFDDMARTSDLPTAEMLGANPQRHPKLFLGHVWSRVPTGAVQWMINSFGPSGSTAFGPQLHYNREGWFRGCLHTSVVTEDPQALIYALHKRVLFDHEGVWFAETADQMRILDDYCRRLRSLPQHVRHTKLQSLPCNPLACELARNE